MGETTALYGLVCGPFTLASHLRGNNLFTDMYDFEDEVNSLFAFEHSSFLMYLMLLCSTRHDGNDFSLFL